MSQFADIIHQLEGFALAEWRKAQSAGEQIVQELVPVLEDAFAKAVTDFGALAAKLVLNFMQAEFSALTGAEKHGNVVTGLIQQAEIDAKSLALADAQALAKSAYLAIVSQAPG